MMTPKRRLSTLIFTCLKSKLCKLYHYDHKTDRQTFGRVIMIDSQENLIIIENRSHSLGASLQGFQFLYGFLIHSLISFHVLKKSFGKMHDCIDSVLNFSSLEARIRNFIQLKCNCVDHSLPQKPIVLT